ncbi:hypothetical protein J5X84_16685 [Streptosporangiaceae bacterium NEAU-GS5]|nr:hypothetical protein [Streptosporangiaceae bacterium NEAU-GS5]
MFNEILGLPAHPLIIHFAVVLTPLLVALSVVYAVLPRFRRYVTWAVVVLAVAAPAAIFAAKESGEAFKERLFKGQTPAPVATHESFANPLLFTTLGLGVAALLLVYVTRPTRELSGNRIAAMALSAATVVLALVVGYYVFRAGDSGARAVWGG